jgi:hypothetical protein
MSRASHAARPATEFSFWRVSGRWTESVTFFEGLTMSVLPSLHDEDQEMPAPRGHAIGFVDSQPACDAIIRTLLDAGFPESSIMVLSGEDGIQLLKRMMAGSLWGEEAEDVAKEGVTELSHGHFALVIEAEDRDEAVIASNVATSQGGHGFSYFGLLTDTRLTK